VVLILNLRWVSDVLAGPAAIQLTDLQNLRDPSDLPNRWVSFTFGTAKESNLAIVSQRSGKARSRFLLIQVGDRWLIADVPADHSGNRITGYLETWSVPLRRESIEKISANFPGHPLMPFQIDAQYNQRGQCFTMLGVMGFLLVCGLVLGLIGLRGVLREAREGS
jgi:hypothetical protein